MPKVLIGILKVNQLNPTRSGDLTVELASKVIICRCNNQLLKLCLRIGISPTRIQPQERLGENPSQDIR